MSHSLAGKVAVVVGGSNGIGRATVRQLAKAGASVFISYNQGEDRAKALLAELPAVEGPAHMAFQLTLESPESVKAAADKVAAASHGKVHVLVNSAGFTKPIAHNNLEALTEEIFESVLKANVVGVYSVIRHFHSLLKASGEAVIVNVSSISGFTGSGSSVAYCASKAALDNITMSLGRALGPEVRVMVVSPGAG